MIFIIFAKGQQNQTRKKSTKKTKKRGSKSGSCRAIVYRQFFSLFTVSTPISRIMKWNHSFKNIFSSSSLRLFVTLKKKEIRNYDVANKQSVIINITHSMNEKILVQIVIMDMKRIKISLSLCAGVFGFWRLFFFWVIISPRVSLQSLRFYSKSQAFFQI